MLCRTLSVPQMNTVKPHWWRHCLRNCCALFDALATYALPDLLMNKLILDEEKSDIEKSGKFSKARGQKLATYLAKRDSSALLEFLVKNNNAFILTAIKASLEHCWAIGEARMFGVPNRPPHYTQRREIFDEPCRRLLAAFEGPEQCWVGLPGPGGAGKTTLCIQLANEMQRLHHDVLWLSFGERSDRAIFEDTQRILANYHRVSLYEMDEELCRKNLTIRETRDVVLFMDDVCQHHNLKLFKYVKCAVITSRETAAIPDRSIIQPVPLSLTEDESKEIFQKVFGEAPSPPVLDVLRKVKFNALATTVLAVVLKDASSEFEKVTENLSSSFEVVDPGCNETREFFPLRIDPNIFKILRLTIDRLSPNSKEDFYRLAIFPKGQWISVRNFAPFHNNTEFLARKRLESLVKYCILEQPEVDGYFVIHDLWLDQLRERVTEPQKKQYLVNFCESCMRDWPKNMYWDSEFLLERLPLMCVEVEKPQLALQLLSSVRFLYHSNILGKSEITVTNLLSLLAVQLDYLGRLDAIISLAVNLCYKKWLHRGYRLIRTMALITRDVLFPDILQLATEVGTTSPLFRFDGEKKQVKRIEVVQHEESFMVNLPFKSMFKISTETIKAVPFESLLEQPLNVHFLHAEINWNCSVAWIPLFEDFVLFFRDPEEEEIFIQRPNGEILLQQRLTLSSLSYEVRACSDRAALWEDKGRRVLLFFFRDDCAELVEEKVMLDEDERMIYEVLPSAFGSVVRFHGGSVEIWDERGRQTVADAVRAMAISECGTKLALVDDNVGVLEFEGGERRTHLPSGDLHTGRICYLPDGGILMWRLGEALLFPRQDAQNPHSLINFPCSDFRRAAACDDLVFLITEKDCWLYDLSEKRADIVVKAKQATLNDEAALFGITCNSERLFLQCEEGVNKGSKRFGCFSMRRLRT